MQPGSEQPGNRHSHSVHTHSLLPRRDQPTWKSLLSEQRRAVFSLSTRFRTGVNQVYLRCGTGSWSGGSGGGGPSSGPPWWAAGRRVGSPHAGRTEQEAQSRPSLTTTPTTAKPSLDNLLMHPIRVLLLHSLHSIGFFCCFTYQTTHPSACLTHHILRFTL